jgi:hypothetical protein
VAGIGRPRALIYVCTAFTIACKTLFTTAGVTASGIFAFGIGVTFVKAAIFTFVDIRAGGAISLKTLVAHAGVASVVVDARGVFRAGIHLAFSAFVDIPAVDTVAAKATNANALCDAV